MSAVLPIGFGCYMTQRAFLTPLHATQPVVNYSAGIVCNILLSWSYCMMILVESILSVARIFFFLSIRHTCKCVLPRALWWKSSSRSRFRTGLLWHCSFGHFSSFVPWCRAELKKNFIYSLTYRPLLCCICLASIFFFWYRMELFGKPLVGFARSFSFVWLRWCICLQAL